MEQQQFEDSFTLKQFIERSEEKARIWEQYGDHLRAKQLKVLISMVREEAYGSNTFTSARK